MPAWLAQIDEVLIAERAIQQKVAELASRLAHDYEGKNPLFVCVLRGGAIFLADLIRHIDLSLMIDFIAVSSYGSSRKNSGEVRLVKDLETSVQGKDLILVEDIVDTGLTLDYLLRNLVSRRPASLRVCSLLSKSSRRKVEVPVDYVGFEIPDCFVVGYGLDYRQQFRNLPFVALLRT